MESEKKFITKTGYCHILPDKIVLTRNGIIGDVAEITVGTGISRILIIYGMLTLVLLYYAYDSYIKLNNFNCILLLLIAVYLIIIIILSAKNSSAPVIDRKSIQKIKFIKAIPVLTRARFEVIFTDIKGRTKKRLIMMPGFLTGGQEATEIAYKIMLEENLIEK